MVKKIDPNTLKMAMQEAIERLGPNPMHGTVRAYDIKMHEEPCSPARDGVNSVLPDHVHLDAPMGEKERWEDETSVENLQIIFWELYADEFTVLWKVEDGKPVQVATDIVSYKF